MDPAVELKEILDRLTLISERTDDAMSRIETEVVNLRETRYRPYLVTASVFFGMLAATVGWMYSVQMDVTSAFFKVSAQIADVRTEVELVNNRSLRLERSLSERDDQRQHSEDLHQSMHEELNARVREVERVIVKELSGRKE